MSATPNPAPDRTMRVVLIVIAALLLVVAILLAAMLLKKPGVTGPATTASPSSSVTTAPSASPTAKATASAPRTSAPRTSAPTTTTTAPTTTTTTTHPPGPTFASFSAPASASCPDDSSVMTITIKWSSSDATSAWIGVGTKDAKAAPYDTVPTSGSYDIGFPCSNSQQVYTVTLEDASGHLTSKSKDIQR